MLEPSCKAQWDDWEIRCELEDGHGEMHAGYEEGRLFMWGGGVAEWVRVGGVEKSPQPVHD